MRPALLVPLLALAGLAACDACGKGAAAHLTNPPAEVVHAKVSEHFRAAKDLASTICGVPVLGLEDLKLEDQAIKLPLPGTATFRMEGKPVQTGPDGGAPLLCIATMFVVFTPVTDTDGKVTDWKLGTVRLHSVETPGVTWKAPPSGDWD
jgi:hypothetical protein